MLVMKPCKNGTLQFSPIFMTPGETLQKLNALVFSNFHDPGYMKPCKNGTLQFSPIFMTPGTRNLAKIECFNFL